MLLNLEAEGKIDYGLDLNTLSHDELLRLANIVVAKLKEKPEHKKIK
jgi:hypothetical protein